MSSSRCARVWEAEAARDGRLEAAALASHQLHAQHCTDCSHERQALDELSASLQARSRDELVLRRLRQRVMASMNQLALSADRGSATPQRRAAIAAGALAIALLTAWFANSRQHAPLTLQLVPESGARYIHERRHELEYVELHEGVLSISFDRSRSDGLVVRVPDGEIRDLGTVFRVVVADGKTQEIAVQEGAVMFRRAGEAEVQVLAGQVYRRAPGQAPPPKIVEVPDASVAEQKRPVPELHSKAKTARRSHTTVTAQTDASGSEQQDSAYLRILALLQEGRSAEARVAAQEYLSRFPNGFRRGEVERIVAPPVTPMAPVAPAAR